MAGPVIELSGVEKRYGAHRALAGVDLSIEAGVFTALVGGSGSGKTTLLKTINRLVTPDAGTLRVLGSDVADAEPHLLRRKIGYVFQEVGLFPHLSVAENIAVTPKLLGWERARIDARIANLLGLVDLPLDVAGRAPAALSGGQRQRVGVARALATQPDRRELTGSRGGGGPGAGRKEGSSRALAEEYGVSHGVILKIIHNEKWTAELEEE